MPETRIYLDVSCLNRPFDDQTQVRIRLESEAVTLILAGAERGQWRPVSSEMARIEIRAIPDAARRRRVLSLLPSSRDIMALTESSFRRGRHLVSLGFKPADAMHIAAAEQANADVFLSCDDRLVRRAQRVTGKLRLKVLNPLTWLRENADE